MDAHETIESHDDWMPASAQADYPFTADELARYRTIVRSRAMQAAQALSSPGSTGIVIDSSRRWAPRVPLEDCRAVLAVRELHEAREHGTTPQARDDARAQLAEVMRAVVSPYQLADSETYRAIRSGRQVERTLGSLMRKLGMPFNVPRWLRLGWRWGGVGLSLVAALLLPAGFIQIALAVVIIRVLSSLVFGIPGLPADAPQRVAGWSIDWVACVAGHASDALVLGGVSALLFVSQRTGYGLVVLGTIVLMLTATMARVAALQQGVWLERLRSERIVRNLPVLLGLAAACVWQTPNDSMGVPPEGLPIVALTATGAFAFALVEIGRTVVYSKKRSKARSQFNADELFTDTAANLLATVDPRGTALASEQAVVRMGIRRDAS